MGEGQKIGVVDAIQARLDSVVAANAGRMSPAALHALDPKRFARPVPVPGGAVGAELERARMELAAVRAELRAALTENGQLRRRIEELLAPRKANLGRPIAAIMEAFCVHLRAAGYLAEGAPVTSGDMVSPKRRAGYVGPRHVAMWTCRRLCKRGSYPRLAEAFGMSDHTSAQHAVRRAPDWMAEVPALETAAKATLRAFGEPLAARGKA